MYKNSLALLRILGLLEGISFLLLLGIGVPLKYGYDMPEPNKVIGMIHGVLFIAYCYSVLVNGAKFQWSIKIKSYALIAAVLPFGTFVADKKIFRGEKN